MACGFAACLTTLLALQAPQTAPAPVDLGDVVRAALKRPEPDEPDPKSRSILPTMGASPDAGFSLGMVVSIHERRNGSESPISTTTVNASYSTKGRGQVMARIDHSFAHGRWRLTGDWRLVSFTEKTYGLGSDTRSDAVIAVPLEWGRAHLSVYRTVAAGIAAGVGYHLDAHRAHDVDLDGTLLPERMTFASGLSVAALVDTRDNFVNPNQGVFARTAVYWFAPSLGSTRPWQSLQAEGRTYWRAPALRRHVVAIWTSASLTLDGTPTYFDLPSTGSDTYGRSARGYAAGRFRGRDWIDLEAEYRADVMMNGLVGVVAFTNASTFSDLRNRFGRWVAGGGAGLRIKLDKRYGTNLCVDYGWGVDGSRGLFLSLNEAF